LSQINQGTPTEAEVSVQLTS